MYGEDLAGKWYLAAGYRIVERNWRCRSGELDLVLGKDDLIVFCEVKARSGDRFGTPAEAVGRTKQARIRRLAGIWLSNHPARRRREIRFDVAAVNLGRIEIIEEAF